jgi:hypothetical protein
MYISSVTHGDVPSSRYTYHLSITLGILIYFCTSISDIVCRDCDDLGSEVDPAVGLFKTNPNVMLLVARRKSGIYFQSSQPESGIDGQGLKVSKLRGHSKGAVDFE